MTYEDVQEMREEGGFCPCCGEHKVRGRECLCCGWVKAPPDYAVKCDVVEVEASTYIGYANMEAEAERWRKLAVEAEAEAERMRGVWDAASRLAHAARLGFFRASVDTENVLPDLMAAFRAAREAEEDAK